MHRNVLEYLEHSAEISPDKIAFQDEFNNITYSELMHRSKAIGTALCKTRALKKPIVVMIDRDIESVVMFLGVVYSGNFYVPVDHTLPEKRIKSIIETLSPAAIIAKEGAGTLSEFPDVPVYGYELVKDCSVDDDLLDEIRRSSTDTDPLYSIFTSGSTGTPKGVLITHRGVIDLVSAFEDAFEFSGGDIFGNQAPFDFDVSTKDIYNGLKYGATVDIIPKRLFSFPVKLIEHLNDRKITTIIWAVSAMVIVANMRGMKKIRPEYLRTVMFSGEVMPIKVLNYWQENLNETLFVNLYGPTEITCNCTYYIVERRFDETQTLPIGKPFRNTGIILLDSRNKPLKKGEIGELCVQGSCLALGYYNNAEKTSEAFVQNPLNDKYPEIIYRTGDLVREDDNGYLVYVSRKDFQIKHMGHRIELPEIEIAVNALDFIECCCCIYNETQAKIVLFYQSSEQNDKSVIDGISEILPRYMLPNQYVWMREMPLNAHGKTDRTALSALIQQNDIGKGN